MQLFKQKLNLHCFFRLNKRRKLGKFTIFMVCKITLKSYEKGGVSYYLS